MKGSLTGSGIELKKRVSHNSGRACKLKIFHPTESRFQSVVNFNNYRLLKRSQNYNEKMATKTRKYVKRMEKFMKTYRIDNKDSTKEFRFLDQFKRAYEPDEVSGGMSLLVMSIFIKGGKELISKARMTSWGDALGERPLLKVEEEQITIYFKIVNYLLKSYATERNIAEATLEIALLKNAPNGTSVQFADVLRTKFVCCGNA